MESSFCHVDYEKSVKQPNEKDQLVVMLMILKLRKEIWAVGINLGITRFRQVY